MQVQFKSLADQHGHLHITISDADTAPLASTELKKLKKTANIKGFRQGTVPDSVIHKMYGKAVIADVVNKLVDEHINNYIKSEQVEFVGDMLPVQIPDSLPGTNGIQEIEFIYEVGIAPKVSLEGSADSLSLKRYIVEPTEEQITEELDRLRKRHGNQEETNEAVKEEDIIELNAFELEGDAIKIGGWNTSFISYIDNTLSDDVKQMCLGKNIGEKIRFNIYTMEKELTPENVKKYLLKFHEGEHHETGEWFEGEITKITRQVPAELSEDFFKQAFGTEEIKTIEQANEKIKTSIQQVYLNECDKILNIDITKQLLKKIKPSLPDAFLKKWLKVSMDTVKDMDEHTFDHEYIHFKEGLSWRIIKDQLVKEKQISTDYPEFRQYIINKTLQVYPMLADMESERWDNLISKIVDNKEKAGQYYNEFLEEKVMKTLKELNTITEESISPDRFKEIIAHLNAHAHDHD